MSRNEKWIYWGGMSYLWVSRKEKKTWVWACCFILTLVSCWNDCTHIWVQALLCPRGFIHTRMRRFQLFLSVVNGEHLFGTEVFCNIINALAVSFNQYNVTFLNKSWRNTDIHLQFYTLIILQIWRIWRTVRRQVMQCVHVRRATDAVTANARRVRKFRQLLLLLLLPLKQYRPPMVSAWTLTRCRQCVKIVTVEGKQTITHTEYIRCILYWPVYSFSLLFSFHLLPFYQPLPDNVWISVSLCFACVCVCALLTCFLLISRHARPCGRIMSTSVGQCHYKQHINVLIHKEKLLFIHLRECLIYWHSIAWIVLVYLPVESSTVV